MELPITSTNSTLLTTRTVVGEAVAGVMFVQIPTVRALVSTAAMVGTATGCLLMLSFLELVGGGRLLERVPGVRRAAMPGCG